MSCIELLDILSKLWGNVTDIMKIMNCGRDSAIKMRDSIINEIHKSGKEVQEEKQSLFLCNILWKSGILI